eukprot:176466-Chlamydomonas_euryale.AAC.1
MLVVRLSLRRPVSAGPWCHAPTTTAGPRESEVFMLEPRHGRLDLPSDMIDQHSSCRWPVDCRPATVVTVC